MKEGDKNTRFFHRMATAHKRYNNIEKLIVDGNEVVQPEEIKNAMMGFYEKLYTETEAWRPCFNYQIAQG